MSYLKVLENKSIFIIRETNKKFNNPALLWSMGKDSTTMLWLCRQAFFGEIPFPVLHLDNENNFDEVYEFKKKIAKKWNLDLITIKNQNSNSCSYNKINILNKALKKYNFDALIVGIRRDEHGIRNKERYFSPRDNHLRWNVVKTKDKLVALQDLELAGWNLFATDFGFETNHVRVHPLLHWAEIEIWQYIKEKNVPFLNMYLAQNNKRYRSIGCKCCCKSFKSDADNIDKIIIELKKAKTEERSGRDPEKEFNMQKLRSLGYM